MSTPSTTASAVRKRNPQQEVLWASHKSRIIDLYGEQGLSLKDVMSLMASEYGFFATFVPVLSAVVGQPELMLLQVQAVQDQTS
jgi:hypothetical protein